MSFDDLILKAERVLEGVTDGPWVAEYSGEQGNCVIPHDAQSTREAVCTTHLYYQVADAEFIAAARSLVPELVAELKTTREFRYKVADAVGFVECVESVGNAILADDNTILDYVRAQAETARKHETECPVWCDDHEHFEHALSCKECGGSGCGPGTATGAHEGCDECGGDGRDHDFAYVHAPDVEAELKTTRAQLAALQKPKPEKHPIGRCGDPSCGGDW